MKCRNGSRKKATVLRKLKLGKGGGGGGVSGMEGRGEITGTQLLCKLTLQLKLTLREQKVLFVKVKGHAAQK